MREPIKDIWQRVLAEASGGEGFPIFAGSEPSKPVARLANGGTHERPLPSIYVRLETSGGEKIKNEAFRGFSLQVERGGFASNDLAQTYAIISCADMPFTDIFLSFSERLIVKLEEGSTASKAVQQMISEWIGFFKRAGLQPLEMEEITGLFGELLFLKQLVDKFGASKKTLNSWHGPKGANWDFSLGELLGAKTLVEVKTTIRPRTIITVNNLDQLCPVTDCACWLHFISVEYLENNAPKTENTIVDLISGLKASLGNSADGNIIPEFDELLEMIGYFSVHDDHYKKHSFKPNQVRWHEIGEDFPALSRKRLPPDIRERIDKLNYRLNIAGLDESEPPVQLTK
jgi:hypothetical protein